jgi:hypothetical protein
MSYDLADGPFRVCGVDVKKAYEMAKRLYDLLQVAEDVAAIVAELAEFGGVGEVAADVAAAVSLMQSASKPTKLIATSYLRQALPKK